ncbi:MAG: DUF393 domain-containing protein [Chthoniobacterales bacterium]|nr:DUF393 domain-containing protein [Chthoniobacterales bacterium]
MSAPTPESSPVPVLYWDADCNFCRQWVARWKQTTGDRVDYRTLQTAPEDVRRAAGGESFERVVLRNSDGSIVTGARAALTALSTKSRCARLLLGCTRRLAVVSAAFESCYAWIAAHRVFCGKVTRWIWGADTLSPSYEVSGWLFPRLVGAVFLAAFLSLWTQIDGLAGSRGILPVAGYLEAVEAHFTATGAPHAAWWQMPSLLWFGASDGMLQLWLAVGTAASVLLALGIFAAPAALAAWVCYLAFVAAVPVFLGFQWDALLLETGLLVALYAPWQARLRFGESAPSRIGRLLVWWLLFRLMFESGLVKLHGFDASGRNACLDGTALQFHYFTQPIPAWTSWWMAQAPAWFHKLCLLGVFAIELVLPFLIIGPRRVRMVAFWGFSLLMAAIMLTGNYGFFNLLTLTLCITLVDDACWPSWIRAKLATEKPRVRTSLPGRLIRPLAAAIIVFASTLLLLSVLRVPVPRWAWNAVEPLLPLRSTNSYGLFSVMTTERPEITIETSADGEHWSTLQFRRKISPESNAMPFFAPHMPRLDWQMWFAALEMRSTRQLPAWFVPFLGRLQEGSPGMWGLLDMKNAPTERPEYVRIRLDLLTFATPDEKESSGRVWNSQALGDYTIEGRLSR